MFLVTRHLISGPYAAALLAISLLPTDVVSMELAGGGNIDNDSRAKYYFQQAWESDDCEFAVDQLTKAIALDDSRPEFFHRRAYCLIQLNEYRKALVDLNLALNLAEDFVFAYVDRAVVREQLGNVDGAISDYTRAIELDEERVELAKFRGRLYYETGQYQRAAGDLKWYIAGLRAQFEEFEIKGWSPQEEDAMLLLAKSYLKSNQMEAAAETYERILAANPNQSCAAKQLKNLGIEP